MTDAPTTPPPAEDVPAAAPDSGRFSGISAFQYLLLTGCLGALGLMAARSLLGSIPTAHASSAYRDATAAVDDTLEILRKAVLAGEAPPADSAHEIRVTPDSGPYRLLQVESRIGDAPVATVRAAGSFRPAPAARATCPDDLPRVSAATVATLLDAPHLDVRRVRQDTTIADEMLSGLVVISPGVRLTLRDVVLAGALVSEAALSEEPLGEFQAERAPTVVIEGFLRTEPMPRMPGVSLVLPDGIVRTADASASLSLHGAVVAHDLDLQGRGSLFGQVVALGGSGVAPTLERIGAGRMPREWPDTLDTGGSLRAEFFTYLPADDSWDDVQAMIGYRFP